MSSSLPQGVTITPVQIPTTLDDGSAADFIASVDIRNTVLVDSTGRTDEVRPAGELLANYQPSEFERRLLWLLRYAEHAIGRIALDIPTEPANTASYATVEILPPFQRRGFGAIAADFLEARARENGRRTVQSWIEHHGADLAHLPSPTGFGSVPRDIGARFAERHGYTLEQVERVSHFDLSTPSAHIDALRAEAATHAADYRLVSWVVDADAGTPDARIDDYAWMKSRMATDAPSAGMDAAEEEWNAARVRELDERVASAGTRVLVTVAEHVPTGRLVAFNELVITKGNPTIFQNDTLVLSEHRGHRLGMLVKCGGLLRIRELAPHARSVITWNAEENRPMLSVNEKVGFVPLAYEGAWQKRL